MHILLHPALCSAIDKITVNNVLPVARAWGDDADVPPPTSPLGRYGSPEEDIAPVVLFLASRDAQFLTGYSLAPDGGLIIDSAAEGRQQARGFVPEAVVWAGTEHFPFDDRRGQCLWLTA
ncbi:hypothetical protein [Variovorax atrisoli]|uniref:hypothetical protein n=1 Tax=Variovorax atrisoli TaxID=3394203 RepID=UPI0033952792